MRNDDQAFTEYYPGTRTFGKQSYAYFPRRSTDALERRTRMLQLETVLGQDENATERASRC